MKERPILFSAPMVRAILDGRKTMTRRMIKPQPKHQLIEGLAHVTHGMNPEDDGAVWYDADCINPGREIRCKHGRVGDRLWVRESVRGAVLPGNLQGIEYLADGSFAPVPLNCDRHDDWIKLHHYRGKNGITVPPIHMPRWASRITLEITGVRVELLQDISEEDAKAEGIHALPLQSEKDPSAWYESEPGKNQARSAYASFMLLWESINGSGSWAVNPWVLVISFNVIKDGAK